MRNSSRLLPLLTALTLLSTTVSVEAQKDHRPSDQDCYSILDNLDLSGIREVIVMCRQLIEKINAIKKGGCNKDIDAEMRRIQELIDMAEEQVADHHDGHNFLESIPFWPDLKARFKALQQGCTAQSPRNTKPSLVLSNTARIDPFPEGAFEELGKKKAPPRGKRRFFKRHH